MKTERKIPLKRIDFSRHHTFWQSGDSKNFWIPELFPRTQCYYNVDLGLVVVKHEDDRKDDLLFHPNGCRMVPK